MLRPTDKAGGPARVPRWAWTLLAVVGAVAGVIFGGELGRWIAVALMLAAAPGIRAALGRGSRLRGYGEIVGRWLPLAVVVGLALILLGDLALGRPPASRDHGIHYFQTKILVDELIPRGTLTGFSDRLNSGYPFGDSYPVLGYLITGAANLLSFGAISLRTSYAWGILLIWVIALAAVWWLASTVAKELTGAGDLDRKPEDPPAPTTLLDPRWAGAFAAIAWLIDPGASREGGWNYLMFHGVWPQLLSSALWIASLPATWAAFRRPSPRSLALAALLLGGSVLAHPFGMLTAVCSAAAWPVVTWATGAMRKLPPGVIRWWLIIHALAGLVCVGWLLVFLASAGSMARSPVPWEPLGALATELFAGELFKDHRAWIGPLAVVGLIVALRRGRAMAWLGIGLLCMILVLASEQVITVLRLDLLVSGFKNLQFPRYAIALKPILFAFSGVGAAVLLARLRAVPDRDHPPEEGPPSTPVQLRPAGARLLASLCLAPILLGVIDDRGRLLPRPVGGVEVLEGSIHEAVETELLETLREEGERLAEREPGRPMVVAFLRRGMGGGTYPLFAITDAEAKLVLDGHIPAVNYKYQVMRRSTRALRVLGVTHVLHDRSLTRNSDDRRLDDALEEVGEYGVWRLARLAPLEQGADAEPPARFEVKGAIAPADVSLERDGPERLRVEVEVAGSGHVDVPVGPYRKWRATRVGSGEAVELEGVFLARGVPGLKLPFEGPGAIELAYEKPRSERIAGWVSLATIALLLAALFWGRELELVERLHGPRAVQISWALGLVTLALILVWAFDRQQRQLEETWAELLADHQASRSLAKGRPLAFDRDLVDARAFAVSRSSKDGCDGTLGKDAMAGCTQEDARARVSMTYRSPFLYRCLRVEVPARGSLVITLDEVPEGADLAGFYVREARDLDGVELRLPDSEEFEDARDERRRHHFHAKAEDIVRDEQDRVSIALRNRSREPTGLCFGLATALPTGDE